jgi:hypothetical protein
MNGPRWPDFSMRWVNQSCESKKTWLSPAAMERQSGKRRGVTSILMDCRNRVSRLPPKCWMYVEPSEPS